jgi:hypothetical protein
MRPTLQHRVAIVPGILGTVYGINEEGEARYFDYDRKAAERFAGFTADSDPRLHPISRGLYANWVKSGATEANPRPGTRVIWIRRTAR